jgi:AraC-like DNA-binding protein/quercetin dioxygenase-like cupin family protein
VSAERQPATARDAFEADGFEVRSLAVSYRHGHVLDEHSHPWAQLVYAASGAMQVATPGAAWIVPSTRALWVPPGVRHAITMRGRVAMRTVYLSPARARGLPSECRALEVAPLLRELVLHVVALGMLACTRPEHERLAALLVDLLGACETAPLALPWPRDARARALADRILAEPGAPSTLAGLARGTGASLRTQQRLFLSETSLSLEAWRTRTRMQHAVVRLAAGASVTETALEAGYRSPSAFIAAFKQAFGVTPARYRRRPGGP